MLTEVTLAMDTDSAAPFVVGSTLVPHARRYDPRWFERGDRTYVTLRVPSAVADGLVERLMRLHRSVRCISQNPVAVDRAV